MARQSGLLVGGQGEVGQVVGGTLRGPGPDQAPPVWVQHRHVVVHYVEIETSQLDLANRYKGGSETCLCRCLPSTG